MKVLDLQCAAQHRFEAWFGSEADFQDQLQRELVECPFCGSQQVTKRPSAPRLNLRAARSHAAPADTPPGPPEDATLRRAQATWFRWARRVAVRAEDVGERFAEEARSIQAGEAEDRLIRGRATPEQAVALLQEGIPVVPLPPAAVPGKTLQ